MPDQQKKTTETFDEVQARYNSTVNKAVGFTGMDVDFFTQVKARYLLWQTMQDLGETSDLAVLDVGCGVGNFHPLLAPHVGSLDAVDVSVASIERAAQSNPAVRYKAYDGDVLPYDTGSFDLVFAVCVVHHVPPDNWNDFFLQLFRVLRPGGLAMVFEHNPRNPLTMRTVNNCPFDEDAVLLKSRELKGLFSHAGFERIRTRFILYSVGPPGGAISLRPGSRFCKFAVWCAILCRRPQARIVSMPQKSLFKQLSRFTIVGILATLTYLIVANLLFYFDAMDSAWASVLAYLAGMVVSFTGQSRFTFEVSRNRLDHIVKFVLLSALGLGLSFGLVRVADNFLIAPVFGTVCAAVVIPILSYFIMRFWVFADASPK
jgi:SAM-dependent methyltransferase